MNDSRRQLLQGFLRIGVMIGLFGLVMTFMQPRDSDEFVVSVCSAAIGGLLVLGAVIASRVIR